MKCGEQWAKKVVVVRPTLLSSITAKKVLNKLTQSQVST